MELMKNASIFGALKDRDYMSQALQEARKAFDLDEVPIGAVVVNADGFIIGRGYNMVEHGHSQSAHAEVKAIAEAGKAIKDWRLSHCWLFVTLEPCLMCIGLIRLSRLAGIVYGASSPLFGFRLDNTETHWVYNRDAFVIIEGVCVEESVSLLKKFFQKKRKNGECDKTGY